MSVKHSIAIILVVALVTFFTRLIPFLFFGRKKESSETIQYLGKVLPPSIIALLVVYCLRNIHVSNLPNMILGLLAAALTAVLHIWKKNILISIAGGTLSYMMLVQMFLV